MPATQEQITRALAPLGDKEASVPIVYEELRAMATILDSSSAAPRGRVS